MLGPGGPCGRPQTDAAPGPFTFAVMVKKQNVFLPGRCLRTATIRVRFPAAAPILTGCASARGRVPKTQLTPGSTEAACRFHFFHLGSWQTSNALALQASLCGSVTQPT